MKKGFKSFLKYVLFSGFLSVSAVASPIASPGTSTVYSGTNSSLIYSPTVTSGSSGGGCDLSLLRPVLVDQHSPGTYIRTVDLSSFANCGNNITLVIKAAGGEGNWGLAGLGGITILNIPLSTFLQEYGTQVTFYYLVDNGGYKGGGGGESLVSLNNWPWNGGVPLAIGGGGGSGGADGTNPGVGGGGGGGGNDCGAAGADNGDGNGGGGGCHGAGGAGGSSGDKWYSYGGGGPGGSGGSGWYGYGGNSTGGGGGGAGYGGGGGGGGNPFRGGSAGGGGGGGYCNTSLGTCEASDWTNGGGNWGSGYVEIYIEDGVEIPTNTTLP